MNAYNTTFLNTTFNKTNVSLILSNLTVQWYARVNVTNSSGSALVATINDTDNQSNHAFYGYYSLSPFFIVNDTFISSVANFSFNNHMIIANYTPYADNITSFNFSYRDATVNLTIYEITNTAPNVTIQSPPNGYAFNGTSILSASFIAIDDNASTMNCTLYSNATGAISVGNASDSVANNTLTWFNFTVPGDLDSPLWINITCTDGSLTGVSNATNISRWECWNISFDTTLTEDVSHWGSCFHVINNQTSLDCNGHSIVNQDVHGDTGSGVYFEEKNAITIENCWFSRYPVAIYPVNVNDTVIRNNTIFSNASVSNTAGILWTTTGVIPHMVNNSIYNNTIEINSTNGYAIGVYVVNGGWDLNGTNIENNTIRANSTNGLSVGVDFNAFGLWLYKTNVSNNKITTISTTQPSYGIYLSSTSEANETEVLNNNISSRSNNNLATGILIRNGGIDFNKTTIRNNTVNSSARLDQATGIELDNGGGTTMGDNVIKNNIIYVNSTNSAFDSYGAYVLDVRTSLFSNNDFYAQSQIGTAYGIMLDGALSDSNNFTQNHFYYGTWSLAVVNGNADQNLFWLNTFSAKRTYGGYVGDISGDNYYNSSHYGNYWGDILSTTICDSNGDGIGDTFTPYDFTKGNVTDLVEDYHPLTPKVCGVVGGGGGGIGIIPLAGGCLDGTKIQECSTVNVGWICADNKELEVANQCQPQKVEERPILPSWWEWNKLIVAICTMVAIYYLWDERDTLFQIVPELPEEEVMEE